MTDKYIMIHPNVWINKKAIVKITKEETTYDGNPHYWYYGSLANGEKELIYDTTLLSNAMDFENDWGL